MVPEQQHKDLKRRARVYLPLISIVLALTYLHISTFLLILTPLLLGSWYEHILILRRIEDGDDRPVWPTATCLWGGQLISYIYLYQMGWYWPLYPILVAAMSDTGGYIGGRYGYGPDEEKQIIWPAISPSKTLKGTLCGILCSLLLALIFWISIKGWPSNHSLGILGVLCGCVTVAGAQWGDFWISGLKRSAVPVFERNDGIAGLKDSHEAWYGSQLSMYTLMAHLGQGGFCDRTSSHAYAAIGFVTCLLVENLIKVSAFGL